MEKAESSAPVALITGAGSGIGRATAVALGERGWSLALLGRREAPLRETAGKADGSALILARPVGPAREAWRIVEDVIDRFGRLDALINNAGIATTKPPGGFTPDEVRDLFEVNAVAPAALLCAAWPHFARGHARDGRRSTLVNVSSMASVDPFVGLGLYGASKASLNTMATGAAREGATIGLRAFAVAPGAVETPMLRSIVTEAEFPRERTLLPEAVGRVIADCVLGHFDDRSGQVIYVPGPGA